MHDGESQIKYANDDTAARQHCADKDLRPHIRIRFRFSVVSSVLRPPARTFYPRDLSVQIKWLFVRDDTFTSTHILHYTVELYTDYYYNQRS